MTLKLNGSTAGSVSIDAPADTSPTGTDVTLTLPTSAGSSGQYLQTNGSGTLSWQTVAADAITEGNTSVECVDTGSDGHITFDTEGSEAARFDSSGNLGLNETSPSTFNDAGTGGVNFVIGASGSGRGVLTFASEQTDGADSPLGIINFVDSDTTNAATRGARIIGSRGSDANTAFLKFETANSGSPTERMRISSSGQVGIGRSPAYALDVKAEDQTARLVVTKHAGNNPAIGFADSGTGYENGHIHAYSLKIATGTSTLFSGTTGVQLANGATSWSTLSDERQKTNLAPIENGLSKVAGLRACTGRYLTDDPEKSRSFLIAQDVKTVLPEAVFAEDDADETLNLRYTEVIPLLVAALKESKERIETLETANASQAATIASLDARLTALEGGAS